MANTARKTNFFLIFTVLIIIFIIIIKDNGGFQERIDFSDSLYSALLPGYLRQYIFQYLLSDR